MHMLVPPSAATRPTGWIAPPRGPRTVRVGLLGLGQVGQAVARATLGAREVLRDHGLAFSIAGALVRDPARPRHCPGVPRLTASPEAFLRGQYDVVVEALGGVEPARSLVARLLGRGVPVVTANKSLVAAHGRRLQALARSRRTVLHYEAAVLAGVPFVGTLLRRPLVASARAVTGIVNGTSHFILSTMEGGVPFEAALADAQARGYAEPDPSNDVDGTDGAEKLSLLLDVLGAPHAPPERLPVESLAVVREEDLVLARRLGGTLKPIVRAHWSGDALDAFVGPAFVPGVHPLSSLSGCLNGICLDGPFVGDLFYSGPGAGPDVTAATLIDDAVEVVSAGPGPAPFAPRRRPAATVAAGRSAWFVCARTIGGDVAPAALAAALRARGVPVRELVTGTAARSAAIGLLTEHCAREQLQPALAGLATEVHIYRVLEAGPGRDRPEALVR